MSGIETTTRGARGTREPDRSAGEPVRIGRYVVLSEVGAGGMGTVYAAYDPDLDRRVALKVVRVRGASWGDVETARRRLLREGQALASLVHENVVPIFDVGTFEREREEPGVAARPGETDAAADDGESGNGDVEAPTAVLVPPGEIGRGARSVRDSVASQDVFIAMEFVEGTTLSRWLEHEPHWHAVLGALLAGGRGLAAAHAAGIIHGDFKPANVLVADDGRILVADFGLARPSAAAALSSDPDGSSGLWLDDPIDTLTHVLGTPAFMAPEQYRGITDTAADQFAFCVTAWLSLYGRHPFAPPSADAEPPDIASRIRAGLAPREAPLGTSIPPAIGGLLRRGLHHQASRRWPSLQVLIDELDAAAGPRRRRRRSVLLVTAATVATLGAVAVWNPGAPQACSPEPSALEGVDGDAALARLGATLTDAAPTWRGDALALVREDLERWAEAWREEWAATCPADDAAARGHANAAARRRCLERAARSTAAFVDVLADGDDGVWSRAPAAAADLAAPARCAAADIDHPKETGDPRVDSAVEADLARARAQHVAGRYEDALALGRQAESAASHGASTPLRLQARYVQAEASAELGRLDGAAERLEEVVWGATTIGRGDLALDAMISLVVLDGVQRADHDAGLRWGQRAAEAISRRPASPESEASLHNSIGLVHQARGDFTAAAEHLRRALELSRAAGVPVLREATTLGNLGNILQDLGDPGAAEALREALRLREAELGPRHPDIASSASNLGLALQAQHRPEEARALLERAISITEDAFGPDAPQLAYFLNNLANVSYDAGDLSSARPLYDRTRELLRRAYGDDHPSTLLVAGNLGLVLRQQGDFAAALALQTDVLERAERALPAGHPNLGMVHNNLAGVLASLHRTDEARAHYETALAIREAALGPEHRLVGTTVDNLGRLAADDGDAASALALHGRAFAIWHAAHGPAHPRVASALAGVAGAALSLGHVEGARIEIGHALALLEQSADADPIDLARARLVAAQAWSRGPDPRRAHARELARRALEGMRDRGDVADAERERARLLAQLETP